MAWGLGMGRFFGVLLLLTLLAAGVGAYLAYWPYGPTSETFVEILPGTSTTQIAAELQAKGIVRSRYAFDALRLWKRGTLKAGEYRFDHPASAAEVYTRIERGDVYTLALTAPEGYNIFDIAQAVEAAKLGSADSFLQAERADTSLINDLSPGAPSLEGFLFPDTYRFSRKASPHQILATMVKRFRQTASQVGLTSNVAHTVTLASLVERETGVNRERPLVASVFVNRLSQGMPLATDPTVIYAALLEGRYGGKIYESDLQSESSYNTYKHTGLPPGPICNPGVASLRAAMSPAQTDYLYFVSDAKGHSVFAKSLGEHSKNVQAYRQAEGVAR